MEALGVPTGNATANSTETFVLPVAFVCCSIRLCPLGAAFRLVSCTEITDPAPSMKLSTDARKETVKE